jgi:hypothetical protein
VCICPHLNSPHFDDLFRSPDPFYVGYLELVKTATVLFVIGDKLNSIGTQLEMREAYKRNMLVIESLPDLIEWFEVGVKQGKWLDLKTYERGGET